MADPYALYLHIPFCKAKCAYCDFDSRALHGCALEAAMDAYVAQLLALIDRHGASGELARVQTVYIGGGTPSLLGGRLVELVQRVCGYCSPVEFTCEANPESFDLELARALHANGVTRISLGVQSLNADELRQIGRIHTAEQAMLAVSQAKATGFSTSCDVMCGLPGQTLDTFAATLRSLLALDPDHVSVYPLQLEEGTPLASMEESGELEVPDEDFQARCMDLAADLLQGQGYARYEVASYAKPDHRCLHNISYWTGRPYLGLGRSAASMCDLDTGAGSAGPALGADSVRPDRPGCLALGLHAPLRIGSHRIRYVQLDDEGEKFDIEELAEREAAAEDLMLACRMTDGIGPELLSRAERAIPRAELAIACERAVESGLAAWEAGRLKPTHLGWLEGNELFGVFWGLAE